MQQKKKLFFIIPSLVGGGAERVLISLANHFNTLDYESIIISLNNCVPAYEITCGVQVLFLVNRKKDSPLFRVYYVAQIFLKLLKHLLKEKPVCSISFITSANIWAGITCNLTRTPYVVSERTSPNRSINKFGYFHNHLAARLYKRSNAIVVSASGVEQCLRENKKFNKLNNICKINNAVNVFEPPTNTKVHYRKFILGVGRLTYVKGFDILISAFSMAKLQDVDLLIVGEGDERANLICQIYNLGLSDRVILVGARTNLQDFYSQAELFVLPSRNEGYPNALVEAMSFGCPCVAMNCEFGPAEIIVNNLNGILVDVLSIASLSNAISSLISNPDLKDLLGKNALNINTTNNAQQILQKWENLVLCNS
ncbi:MAG: group 1 glycosyl transferase [Mucilaginibacter sp.]|nr:group 1 glycosyl transferase [Mucilaginibacter sp.]